MTNEKLDELIERIDFETSGVEKYGATSTDELLLKCKAALIEAKEANENA